MPGRAFIVALILVASTHVEAIGLQVSKKEDKECRAVNDAFNKNFEQLQESAIQQMATFNDMSDIITDKVNDGECEKQSGMTIIDDRFEEAIDDKLKKEKDLGSDGLVKIVLDNQADVSKCKDESYKKYLIMLENLQKGLLTVDYDLRRKAAYVTRLADKDAEPLNCSDSFIKSYCQSIHVKPKKKAGCTLGCCAASSSSTCGSKTCSECGGKGCAACGGEGCAKSGDSGCSACGGSGCSACGGGTSSTKSGDSVCSGCGGKGCEKCGGTGCS